MTQPKVQESMDRLLSSLTRNLRNTLGNISEHNEKAKNEDGLAAIPIDDALKIYLTDSIVGFCRNSCRNLMEERQRLNAYKRRVNSNDDAPPEKAPAAGFDINDPAIASSTFVVKDELTTAEKMTTAEKVPNDKTSPIMDKKEGKEKKLYQ
ncbi:uncharacterized protein LOC129567707 isoform X2 [Sitodiplosis mosellana]|uniref:uncharacterized protein LOC129567707 isoform X2 n=1 Tax=Sitodiplosis mosellana TaxID=263140 RepID=UPI00244522CE|nr:uncharacterized protein LOC129567707 isoform X2 [Sitodiplosis mosellana]